MKVALFTDTYDEVNGVANTFRYLTEYCRKAGRQLDIYAHSEDKDSVEEEGCVRIFRYKPAVPIDIYAESKLVSEEDLKASDLPYVNLRIAAISIPAFLDPPEPWPFQPGQRIELVALSDLVTAMVSLVGVEEALGKTLIISGGPTWRVTGEEYVRRWGEIMEIPVDEMDFLDRPGWMNWYDTEESQKILDYQQTPLDEFFKQLEAAVAEALA